MSIRAPLAAGLMMTSLGVPASAQTAACTEITAVPYTVTLPGVYCLHTDLVHTATSGSAITIDANWVTVDFNGYTLKSTATAASTALGVSSVGQRWVTVKNGTIHGFYTGVHIVPGAPGSSNGQVVESLRLLNYRYGVYLDGEGSVARRCEVLYTGGSTVDPNPVGIRIAGPGTAAVDNAVAFTFAGTGGTSRGIYAIGVSQFVVGNRVNNGTYGIQMSSTMTKYRDNLVTGAATPYSGGTDAGNND